MNRETITIQVSEARLNDLVHMILKYGFFQPVGLHEPRGCDIRMCMNLIVPETMTQEGIMAAIMLPNETAPAGHDREYQVEVGRAFDECLLYLEDHWMKCTLEEATGNPDSRQELWDWLAGPDGVLKIIMETPEEDCGPQPMPPPEVN